MNKVKMKHKHIVCLKKFVKYLKTQDKLVTSDDLLDKMLYTYMSSIGGINTTRCILWKGTLINRRKYDCQLNIEIQMFGTERKSYVDLFVHKTGGRLDDFNSWKNEDEPYFGVEK